MCCVPARWWLSDHDVHTEMNETENREADESGRRILACHFFHVAFGRGTGYTLYYSQRHKLFKRYL